MAKAVNQHSLYKQIEDFIREKDAKNEAYSHDDLAFIQQYEGSGGKAAKAPVVKVCCMSFLPRTTS